MTIRTWLRRKTAKAVCRTKATARGIKEYGKKCIPSGKNNREDDQSQDVAVDTPTNEHEDETLRVDQSANDTGTIESSSFKETPQSEPDATVEELKETTNKVKPSERDEGHASSDRRDSFTETQKALPQSVPEDMRQSIKDNTDYNDEPQQFYPNKRHSSVFSWRKRLLSPRDSYASTPRSSFSLDRRKELAQAFEEGVTVSDQWYKIRKYSNVFVGNEAVDYMVESGLATDRQEAVEKGNVLLREMNLFEHVHRDHDFKDDYLFYHFVKKKDRFITVQDEITALTLLGSAMTLGEHDESDTLSVKSEAVVRSLTEVAQVFEKAVPVSDHIHRLRLFRNTFVGSQAVDVMVSYGLASSRADAVELGREMATQLNLFVHVTGDHEFKDDYLFYRFQPASTRLLSKTHDDWDSRPAASLSLEEISEAFEKGIKVATHRYRMKAYPKTFVANEAVDFLVKTELAVSRNDAVRIGINLGEQMNLFRHVVDDRPFADDYLFFQFIPCDERQRRQQESLRSTDEVAAAFRQGVRVRKNRYRLKTYNRTFVGSEAVDFLVNSSLTSSRRDAVQLGRILAREYKLFRHVTGEHEFSDDYLFYRFVDPEDGSKEFSSALSMDVSSDSLIPPDKMAEALRSGVKIRDRPHHMKMYKGVFLGCDAVDFLLGSRYAASREEAVELGRSLAREFDLFHHVTKDHELEDKPLYYRFANLGEIRPLSTSALALSNSQLRDIAKALEEQVEVKTNRHNLRVYNNTFLGSEAVDFLVSSGSAKSRKEAVVIGRALVEKFNLFEHVTRDHFFADQNLFYRFVNESLRASWHDDEESGVFVSVPKFGVVTADDEWRKRVQAFETKMMSKSSLYNKGHDTISEVNEENLDTADRLKRWASEFRRLDPRYQILRFFNDVAQEGADTIEETGINPDLLRPLLRYFSRASVFTVWRPTSYDAIRKMILGEAVGKGLDIKGKSSKRGKLSGFVPFLQISENRHKRKIRALPKHGTVRLFFPENARRGRDVAAARLEAVCKEMIDCVAMAKRVLSSDSASEKARDEALECMLLDMADPCIAYIDDYAPKSYGLEIPCRLLWEAYFVRQDIGREQGSEYDTGRPSQPAFQDMNFAALQGSPKKGAPRAVLYQCAGQDAPMSPFEVLMAYEEHGRVMPVVSDFDCFLVGSRGVCFSAPLPSHQLDVLKWCVSKTEMILDHRTQSNWTSRWLFVLKDAAQKGFHPHIPRFGFGDPKTYSLMEEAIRRLRVQGAVRHGSECFNYYFPQDLDDEFLVVSENISGQTLPWKYVDVKGLQQILKDKIDEGYTFPLNPKWILCDPGWKEIYDKLMKSEKANVQDSLSVWYPRDSGLREQIETIHSRHPHGFQRQATEGNASTRVSGTGLMDLAIQKLKHGSHLSQDGAIERVDEEA